MEPAAVEKRVKSRFSFSHFPFLLILVFEAGDWKKTRKKWKHIVKWFFKLSRSNPFKEVSLYKKNTLCFLNRVFVLAYNDISRTTLLLLSRLGDFLKVGQNKCTFYTASRSFFVFFYTLLYIPLFPFLFFPFLLLRTICPWAGKRQHSFVFYFFLEKERREREYGRIRRKKNYKKRKGHGECLRTGGETWLKCERLFGSKKEGRDVKEWTNDKTAIAACKECRAGETHHSSLINAL